MPLTIKKIQEATKPGTYCDGLGLYLQVAKGGSKSWILRTTINGKRCNLGLGGFPVVTLTHARRLANTLRVRIIEGEDPRAKQRASQLPTFEEAAAAAFAVQSGKWRGGATGPTARQWNSYLQGRAFPAFGSKRIDLVTQEDIEALLAPIWVSKAEAGRKLRRYCRCTFDWAIAKHYRGDNPAGPQLNAILPQAKATKGQLRSLPYPEAPAAWQTIAESSSRLAAKLCLQFTILCASRNGEARGARWEEIDLEAKVWTVPGSRMKRGIEHRVPLSSEAVRILEEAKALSDGSALVFPSPVKPGRPLSDMSLTKLQRGNGLAERTTVHGWRSTFIVWAKETDAADLDTREIALSHQVGSAVERSYDRSELLERRAVLMNRWAQYLVQGEVDQKIVEFRRAG